MATGSITINAKVAGPLVVELRAYWKLRDDVLELQERVRQGFVDSQEILALAMPEKTSSPMLLLEAHLIQKAEKPAPKAKPRKPKKGELPEVVVDAPPSEPELPFFIPPPEPQPLPPPPPPREPPAAPTPPPPSDPTVIVGSNGTVLEL